METKKFRFYVKKQEDDGDYIIALPHQCDDWNIVGDSWRDSIGDGVSKEEAIADMGEFIEEAKQILEYLKRE